MPFANALRLTSDGDESAAWVPKANGHHYVPESYSGAFASADNMVWLFDRRERFALPRLPWNALAVGHLPRRPAGERTAFKADIDDYFAQTPDADWPLIRSAIERRERIDTELWVRLVQYIAAQIVRTPLWMNAVLEILTEDAIELGQKKWALLEPMMARYERLTGTRPKNFREVVQHGLVSLDIDPYRSISSMPMLIGAIPLFQQGFGFGNPKFLHNETELDFISSDNPIVYQSGHHGAGTTLPYTVYNSRNFAFCFPISPRIMMVNAGYDESAAMHRPIVDRDRVTMLNRMVASYSYRYVMAGSKSLAEHYGRRFCDICVRPDHKRSLVQDGNVAKICYRFGKPETAESFWDFGF